MDFKFHKLINYRRTIFIFLLFLYASSICLAFPDLSSRGQLLRDMSPETKGNLEESQRMLNGMIKAPRSNARHSDCVFEFEGLNDGTDQNLVYVYASCSDTLFYNKTLPIAQHQTYEIPNTGITIFPDSENGAYIYFKNSDVSIVDSRFINLPPLPGKATFSIMIVDNAIFSLVDSIFERNIYGTMAGCIYFEDRAQAAIINCVFNYNRGVETGVLTFTQDSKGSVRRSSFFSNTGDIHSGSAYTIDRADLSIDGCTFSGTPPSKDFKNFLRNNAANDNEINDYLSPKAGAIAAVSKSTLSVTNCTFTQHSGQLGTIYAVDSTITYVKDSKFVENFVASAGGVYFNSERDGYLRIALSVFERNVARYGGAVVVSGEGSFSLDDSTFDGNTALWGGALYGDFSFDNTTDSSTCPGGQAYKGTEMTIEYCKFTKNVAQNSGGAFYTKCTDIRITGAHLDNNVAGSEGGAIFVQYAWDLEFRDTTFKNNLAAVRGGALYADDAHIIYTKRTNFDGNDVRSMDGGGVFARKAVALNLSDTVFVTNSAGTGGGAVSAVNIGEFILNNTVFGECQGGKLGGALSSSGAKKMNMINIVFYNNTANSAGAVHIDNTDDLMLENVQFVTNVAVFEDAGALNIEKTNNALLKNITFNENRAYYSCGALRAYKTGKIKLTDSFFSSNIAQLMNGGSVCIEKGDNSYFDKILFEESRAQRDGGNIYFLGSSNITIENSIIQNGVSENGGAIAGEGLYYLILRDLSLLDNVASLSGGAIFADGVSHIDIKDCEFISNYAGLSLRSRYDVTTNSRSYLPSQGGAITALKGETFISSNSLYQHNNADVRGGMLMLEDYNIVSVSKDIYLNGTARKNGGCMFVTGVNAMKIDNTELLFCDSSDGGAVYADGKTLINVFMSAFVNNTAVNGGALSCQGDTTLNIAKGNFTLNSASTGSTLDAACICRVNITDTYISRDDKMSNNGDFFEDEKTCTYIATNDVTFVGAIVFHISLSIFIAIIAFFGAVGCIGTAGSMIYFLSIHKPGPGYVSSSDEENPDEDLAKPLIEDGSMSPPQPPLPSKKSFVKPAFKRIPTDVGLPDDSSEFTSDYTGSETDSWDSNYESEDDNKHEGQKKSRDLSLGKSPLITPKSQKKGTVHVDKNGAGPSSKVLEGPSSSGAGKKISEDPASSPPEISKRKKGFFRF